ncbi:MAG TPA: hypothetical protein VEC16_05345 [Alphaproteobacteria bacterium]|nr:hypothetical protein [Alphaproteobacteria bacterium]
MNETLASSVSDYLSNDLYTRGVDIVFAPVNTPAMLWMLLPLLATLFLMEFYFGRYKDEEMGWNTAFSNAIVLVFIAIDLFRRLYEPTGLGVTEFIATGTDIKIIVPLWIMLLAIILLFINFFHFMPKKLAYIISSPAYINMVGLLGIIVVYSKDIPLDWTTIFACAILFLAANAIALLLYYLIPSYKPTISKILTPEDVEKYGEELRRKKNK